MRKFIAFTFIALYIFSSAEFFEMLKVPMLISHYNEHRQEDKALSLWGYLCLHYAHGDVHDSDREKDMKLPYKNMDASGCHVHLVYLPNHDIWSPNNVFPEDPNVWNNYYNSSFISSDFSFIWQPPKIA